MVWKIHSKLSNIQSRHFSEVFENKKVIFSQKQPKKSLQLLIRARFNAEVNAFWQENRLFRCFDKRLQNLFTLYCERASNNMRWELWSHATSRSVNIKYYLKCNISKKKETYIGKTVDDNILDSNLEWPNKSVIVEREIQHENSSCMSISVVWKTNAEANHFLKLTPWWD